MITKDLNINGIVHAKYIIEKNVLYINVLQNFYKTDRNETEQHCLRIIKLIEEEQFTTVAFPDFK